MMAASAQLHAIRLRVKKGRVSVDATSGQCRTCGASTESVHYRGWSSYDGYYKVFRCEPCLNRLGLRAK